jgi:uncharacterized MAPEG superfamily protein
MGEAAVIVLIAGLMPVVCAGIAKWGAKGYDNHAPRHWMARLEGYRARADAAQQNSLEAFPFFAAGMVLAMMGEADQNLIEQCGWFFVAMRAAYIYLYVTDQAMLRSIVWMLGYAAVIRLYLLSI